MTKFARLGQLIKTRRNAKGYTQSKFALLIGQPSFQFISSWERGECGPPLDLLPKIADVLEINPKDIIAIVVSECRRELDELFDKHTA